MLRQTLILLMAVLSISISDAQNVGIGTTTPTDKLHVSGGYFRIENDNCFMIANSTVTNNNSGINLRVQNNSKAWLYWNNPGSYLTINTASNGARSDLTIGANGNVGIGTNIAGSPLSFPNLIGNKISLWGGDATHDFGIGINSGVMQFYTAGMDKIAFGWGNANAFNETLRFYTGDGLISFPNVLGNKISFWSSGQFNDFGIGINPGVMQIYTAGQDKIAFGWGNTGNFIETVSVFTGSGQVGIGTTNVGSYRLAVNGSIRSKEVRVESGWADFVFDKEYELSSLPDVEKYIQQNKHLPDIPSAKEIQTHDLPLGEMQTKMMQKIEELTLYVIELNKKITELEQQNKLLKNK